MITLDELLELIPESVYFERKNTNSNIYKMAYIIWYVFDYINTIREGVRNHKDITTIAGVNLERWAAGYGLTRDGMTDDELRIRLSTKIANTVNGVTIPGILNILSEYVDTLEDLVLTERSDPGLGFIWNGDYQWDGSITWSGSGDILWRAFDVDLDAVSGIYDPDLGAAIDEMKIYFKGAGIKATIDYF